MSGPARKRLATQADVVMGDVPPDSVGLEIVLKLAAKGFCVISSGLEQKTLDQALREVSEFDSRGQWTKVNAIVQDGLLGTEGSCQIVELESPDLDDEVRAEGEMISQLDYTLTHMGFKIEPYLGHLGVEVSHRTLAIMHQTGEPDEEQESVPLEEKSVMKWMAHFLRHKVMVIIFLGPTRGTLELLPYHREDTELHEVHTEPGMMVVLRPELMSHRFFSPGRSFAVSCFFLASQVSKHSAKDKAKMIPAARELDEWTMGRLRELKVDSDGDRAWNPDIPREWQHAMNHLYHKGQMVAVKGEAIKCCMQEDFDDLWKVSTVGPDYVTDVPLMRWDHTEVFDPDLESWRYYKTYCRHASFMDGIELFDCKAFSMSPNEAKAIDPHQRLILETGYAALHRANLRKNHLVNMACGVYVGCGNSEWNNVPKDDSGAFGATGGALSISSGRFSFTLGMKGPSMTLDTESSSGSTAIHLAADAMERKGRTATNDWGLAIGAHICLAPINWPMLCAQSALSLEGRCFTFNASAAGFVRADGVGAVAMTMLADAVDGVAPENDTFIGTLAGSTMNNNGRGASLTSPSGPAEQEAIADAVRNASISIFDVDSVEAFGAGGFLADAIEVGSLIRAHRTEDVREPLGLTALKSSFGNQVEVSGISAFLKTLHSMEMGTMTPNVHLRQANPHVDAFDSPGLFVTQLCEYKMSTTYAGTMSRGNGGSNIYLLGWGQLNDKKVWHAPAEPADRECLTFWPGGGGNLDSEKQPAREYTIVGSWGQWPDPKPMEPEGDGVFGYTVTLGENRWEWFIIWLDGDPTKVLHPGFPKASKDFPVLGPVEDCGNACWLLDGRTEYVYVPYEGNEALADKGAQIVEDEFGQKVVSYELMSADAGMPGDMYRIRLRVAGKWRTVTWERLRPQLSEAAAAATVPPTGEYYLAGSWSSWELELMTRNDKLPGLFYKDIVLTSSVEEFQVVRNKDLAQVIYPIEPSASSDRQVCGPDDFGEGYHWCITGIVGTRMRIEFQRSIENKSDTMKVSWRRVDESSQE